MDNVFKELERNRLSWGRLNNDNIFIYVDGYKTQNCNIIEKFMRAHGYFMIEQDFDKICGKTKNIFKKRK